MKRQKEKERAMIKENHEAKEKESYRENKNRNGGKIH